VVAADERDAGAIAHLQSYQKLEGLNAIQSAVDEVAEEEVVGIWWVAADAEKLDQVEELAVDVAADLR